MESDKFMIFYIYKWSIFIQVSSFNNNALIQDIGLMLPNLALKSDHIVI